MSGDLFGPIFVPDAFREAVSGRAWLQAMLDAERALAIAEARAGLIPPEDAEAIARHCNADLFDPGEIGHGGRPAGNPVPALARALTGEVAKTSEAAARHVHRGATSQDITDTAAMLVSRRTLDLILVEVDGIVDACARLARDHRDTPMAGRTLLQQALPTTFGLKAAGWLVPVLEARRRLRELRASALAAQLGGAAGTLASLGESGLPVLREFALELGLPEPPLPWHTDRTRISTIGEALSLLAGVLGKISWDVILMAQTEVGEVAEPAGEGRGSSSTLPHKRNPILSVTAAANARRVQDLARTLGAAMVQEHERAAAPGTRSGRRSPTPSPSPAGPPPTCARRRRASRSTRRGCGRTSTGRGACSSPRTSQRSRRRSSDASRPTTSSRPPAAGRSRTGSTCARSCCGKDEFAKRSPKRR
jgi:3-carboxy-cis,cis-muconate cycloisomerase